MEDVAAEAAMDMAVVPDQAMTRNTGIMKVPATTTAGGQALPMFWNPEKMKKPGINTRADAETKNSALKGLLPKKWRFAMKFLDWKVVGLAAGTFLSLTYVLCVIYDLIFPEHAMFEGWYRLLPGFTWLTWGSFFLGLVESFLYGIYVGLVFAPLYNLFNMKLGKP